MKKIWRNEEGVSPVIAVILMVAITVVLAAVLYVMVSGMLGTTNTTPTISMNWEEDTLNVGNYTGNVVRISGSKALRMQDVSVTVTSGSSSGSRTLDVLRGSPLKVGTLILSLTDLSPSDRLGAEDIFTVTSGNTGDMIRLVYIPTGGQMVSSVLK